MKTNNAIYFQCNIDWCLGDLRKLRICRRSYPDIRSSILLAVGPPAIFIFSAIGLYLQKTRLEIRKKFNDGK